MISGLGRRKPRREHEFFAAREIPHIGAVLIHHGETFDAALLGAGLVDEHDVAVEIALFAGDALVDRVGNDVGEAAPIFRRRHILPAVSKLLAAENIPEAEFGFETPVGLTGKAPDDESLGIDGAPALEIRLRIEAGDLFNEGGGIDRNEQAAALQVRGDDLRDAVRRIGVARGDRNEIRDGDRHRLKIAAGDVDVDLRGRMAR